MREILILTVICPTIFMRLFLGSVILMLTAMMHCGVYECGDEGFL